MKNYILNIVTVNALFLFVSISILGQTGSTYYVSPFGNDLNPGTIASPWQTFQYALTRTNAGDIVYFRGGTYTISSSTGIDFSGSNSGTETNPISYFNYPNETPIFDFNAATPTVINPKGMSLTGVSYINLRGFEIRNVVATAAGGIACGIYVNGNNINFERISILNVFGIGYSLDGNNLFFNNCDAYFCYDLYSGDPGSEGDGWQILSNGNDYLATFTGCRAAFCSSNGWDCDLNDGVITWERCWAISNGKDNNGNHYSSSSEGNGFNLGHNTKTASGKTQRLLRNCIAADNYGIGITENNADYPQIKMEIYNCASFHNDIGFINYITSSSLQQSIYKNNIAYNNISFDTQWNGESNIISDHNTWDPEPPDVTNDDFFSLVSEQLYSFARFSDGHLPDVTFMSLVPGSDLIDAGVDIGLPYYGSAPDLGWIEYVGEWSEIPVYSGSVIENTDPSTLDIIYNLDLANIVPATSAFTVRVNTVIRAINSVAISNNIVQLSLSSTVAYGDVITVSYTKPVSNPLQTPSGGEAESLTPQNVSNHVVKAYQLEYVSGNNQTYYGGGMPFPMVFKIKNVTDNVYVTDLEAENLSIEATASTGYQDGLFNNVNDYCGEGINSSCFGGYYYVEPNNSSDFVLSITVTLRKGGQLVHTYLIEENIIHISPPTVSTSPISFITAVSALGGGDVTSDGGATVIERGVCWSTSENPTTENSKGLALAGTGSYTCYLANLDPNTLYYVRAFTRNSAGTGYGSVEHFTTSVELGPILSNPDLTYGEVTDIEGNIYKTIKIGTQKWMAENLKTTKYNDNTSISNVTDDNEWYTHTAPAYCWYKNDAGNYKATYGALYNWYVEDAASNGGKNVCPVNWHIPSDAEWTTLTDYLGGTVVAGGKLKESGTSHWWSPNQGATNETGFSAVPGGGRIKDGDFYGHFGHIGEIGFWWSRATSESDRMLRYNDSKVDLFSLFEKQCGFSIRCIQDILAPTVTTSPVSIITPVSAFGGGEVTSDGGATVTEMGICWNTSENPTIENSKVSAGSGTGSFTCNAINLDPNTTYYVRAYARNMVGVAYGEQRTFKTDEAFNPILFNPGLTYGTVSDIEGNNYKTIQIGTQIWMAENLKSTKLNDGTDITLVSDGLIWGSLNDPGFCWYKNDPITYKNTFGALYNWHTVNTGNLCPGGWHVPSSADWTALANYLGDPLFAADKLKETGTTHWARSENAATNETGFTALPGGMRNWLTDFAGIGSIGSWWSNTPGSGSNLAVSRFIDFYNSSFSMTEPDLRLGLSVRCLKDNLLPTVSTAAITNLTPNSAVSGGNVNSDNGAPATGRGVCWSTSSNPTIDNNKTINEGETSAFTSSITGLTPGTSYYVRAYATNSHGTGYGNEISFTTYKSDAIADVDGNYYNTVTINGQVWMAENLKTTKFNNESNITNANEAELADPSYSWYNNDETYKNPYGALYNWHAVNTGMLCPAEWHVPADFEWHQLIFFIDPASTVEDESLIAGGKLKETGFDHWLSPNAGATNEHGFTAVPGGGRYNTTDFSALGFYGHWWTSTEYITEWTIGAWKYDIHFDQSRIWRSYWDQGAWLSVRCVKDGILTFTAPRLTTAKVSAITQTTAQSGGDVTSDGGAAVTERGVCWNTTGNPTTANDHLADVSAGTGVFSSTLPGLTPGTDYYIRAYATNSVGTSYGDEIEFTTPTTYSTIVGYIKFGPLHEIDPTTTVRIISPPITGIFNSTDGSYQISGVPTGTIVTISIYLAGNIKPVNERSVLVLPETRTANFWVNATQDADGNSYSAVEIGSQIWLSENLKTSSYVNGDPILITTSDISGESTPRYQWAYNGNESNVADYGRLYTWYTVTDSRKICPDGWHVPSFEEWDALQIYLRPEVNGTNYAGSPLKEPGTEHWNYSDANATNETGFTALPGGLRMAAGTFSEMGSYGNWWSTQEYDFPPVYGGRSINLRSPDGYFIRYVRDMKTGFSVRCIKDTSTIVVNTINDDPVTPVPGSLRAAVIQANSTPELDKIIFKFTGDGPFIIKPLSPLPDIIHSIVIDGFSQPGSSAETSIILIELDGTGAGTSSNGLSIMTEDCIIKGVAIHNFTGNGIQITNGNRNLIRSNSIYDNGRNGIQIISGIQNTISANSIYNNNGIGIDLGIDGVTPNNEVEDFNDQDTGPNNLQNYPVLDKVVFSLGEVIISGHLPGKFYGKPFTLDFFASKLPDNNELPDKTRYGEGQTYLGSAPFNTSDPNASFENMTFPYKTIYGDVITATATDHLRNTSEFSMAIGGLPDQNLNNTLLNYYVNSVFPENSDGVSRISRNGILKAVNDAFSTWNDIPTAKFSFNYQGETTEKHAHIDGENVVSFTDDEYLFGDGVLAITAKTLKLGPTDAETQILDADIIYNPYFANNNTWNFGIADDVANVGYFDIQSIATHEIGHILGLLHTGVHNATMWFEMGQGIDARSLEQDDKSWASYKYPEPGNNFGSISGHITYGYDDALTEPIAGALVLAINTATNDTIHSYSDADGNYIVPGLPAGSYSVYIEPLDGDVRGRPLYPKNISLYIYCNTTNTDYPGEFFSGTNESAEEAQDIMSAVTVNAGSGTSGINFITNKDITPPSVISVTPPDISISSDVSIRFSEPLDMSTVKKASCYLMKSASTLPIGGSYTELGGGTNAILFYPEEILDYNTRYTLYITTDVTDLKGNHLLQAYQTTFKTGVGDKKPPTITGIIPTNGVTGVFVDDKIVISFSEPMNKTSVQNSLTIEPSIGPDYSWDNENKILTIDHSSSYTEGANYVITVSTGAKDMSGNSVADNVSSSFTVVASAPPTIRYLEPGNDPLLLTGVTVKTPIVAIFSEPISTLTVNEGTFQLHKGDANGTAVTGKFDFLSQNSEVIFRPYTDLEFNQKYTVILTSGIKDVSQLPLEPQSGKTVSFTTESKPTMPQIKFINPPSESFGANVTIGGKGFDPDPARNTVFFYNNVVAPIISATLTSLTVAVPEGSESGVVRVRVNGVLDDALSPYDFLVIQKSSDPCNEARGSAETGGNSRDVATDFNGMKAYVTNAGSNSVSVVDLKSLTTVKTIQVGEYPLMIDIDPEESRAYVTNHGSRTVSVIDLSKDEEIKQINVGMNPYGVAVSSDGKYVFVANYSTLDVSVVDVDPTSGGFDHVTSNIPTNTRNRNLDIDPNSSMIVVTGDDGLKIIELIKTEFGFDYSTTNAVEGTRTRDTKMLTEAGLAVVSTMDGRLLFIGITKGTDTFGAVVANSGSGARAGQVQPDFSGVFLYVSNPEDNQITVYKMTYGGSGSEIGSYNGFSIKEYWTIPTGISPQGMDINRLNNELVVANEFGEKGTTGSVTAVKICCLEKLPSDDIVAVSFYIKGMMGRKAIQNSLGNMLIIKLNDAIANIDKGKTKTAINSMNAFIGKVTDLKSGGKVTAADAKVLIDAANAIIAKLQSTKSDLAESSPVDGEQTNLSDSITESKLGIIYPNPTTEGITINYEVATDELNGGMISIQVYDLSGRLISNLVNRNHEPGCYSVSWGGSYENGGGPVPRGIYYIRFTAGSVKEVKQIMLVR